jgi:hypothetical protein
MRMLCAPACGSADTQRFQVIYEGGTQQIDTRSRTGGIGFGIGGLGIGAAKTQTKGTQQSISGKRAAPPERKRMTLKTVMFCLLGITAATASFMDASDAVGMGVFYLGVIALIAYGVHIWKWNREVWPAIYQTWQRTWACTRCGCVWDATTKVA